MNSFSLPSDSDCVNSEAVLHVNDDGVTLYANQQMLKQLGQLLIALSETPKDEHYEIHFPQMFYSNISMFDNIDARNVDVVLSTSIAALFSDVKPSEEDDIDESWESVYGGLTIMHHNAPLTTIPR